jgi:hypothetical protein
MPLSSMPEGLKGPQEEIHNLINYIVNLFSHGWKMLHQHAE